MTKEQIKELAELRGTSIEEVEQLIKRGREAREKENRFEVKAGEGSFSSPDSTKA